MKNILLILIATLAFGAMAQTAQPAKPAAVKPTALPAKMYKNLTDSCNALDIVFYTGVGGSMSLDGKNVRMFTSFVAPAPCSKKENAQQDGHIMWQINGREYLTGKMYLTGDSTGYLIFEKNNMQYINALTTQGAGFLHTHGKKK